MKTLRALRMLGIFGPLEQGAAAAEYGAELGKKANETEPCECGHGKPFHFFKHCSPELAAKYRANGFPDGACHLAPAGQGFPAKCGCTMYRPKGAAK